MIRQRWMVFGWMVLPSLGVSLALQSCCLFDVCAPLL